MASAAGGMLLANQHQRAESGSAVAQRQEAKPSTEGEDALKRQQSRRRSRSWLSPHRRRDSASSSSLWSIKSLRRMASVASAAPVISAPAPAPAISAPAPASSSSSLSAAAAAAAPLPPPPPPIPTGPALPSSSSSRASCDSEQGSSSSKDSSSSNSEATSVELSEPSSEALPSPNCPPKRPERSPNEGLFGCAIVDEADEAEEADSPGLGVMRPLFSFPDSTRGRRRRWSQREDPQQANNNNNNNNNNSNRVTSLYVHQLMQEADLAFEAVDAVLADTKRAPSSASVSSGTPGPPLLYPGRPLINRANSSEASLPRTASTVGSKSPPHMKSSSQAAAEPGSRQQARTFRWTLTENMADLFKTQRTKTDHKRPTTPAIFGAWDNDRASAKRNEKERKKAAPAFSKPAQSPRDPATSVGETLRLEPFHCPDALPSPIPTTAAGASKRSIPFEVAIPPLPSSMLYLYPQRVVHHDSPPQRSPSTLQRKDPDPAPGTADLPKDDTNSDKGPIPPPKNPARFAARAPAMPHLPPIPEGFRATISGATSLLPKPAADHRRSRSLNQAAETKGDCVYFRSTPFTLTNPGFRHGPIVFHKSDIGKDSTAVEPVEEELDWVAFQTAIMGGAGGNLDEFFPGEEAEVDDGEEYMADDVVAWFEEFGFETHGELIASDERESDRRSQRDSAGSLLSSTSSPSTINSGSDVELHTPVSSQKNQHAFDAIKLLRNRCANNHSPGTHIIDCVNMLPWAPAVVDGEAGVDATEAATADTKQHGLEGIIEWKEHASREESMI